MRRKNTIARKARAAREADAQRDVGLHAGPTRVYDPLPEAEARKLIDGALDLLREVGVGFEPDPEILDRFAQAGCEVGADGLVKFDRGLVEESLQSVAKSVRLWDRTASRFIEIDDRHTWFVSGMTAIKVIDLDTGEARASNRQDLEIATRVADALSDIDAVCISCKNVSRSDMGGEVDEFVALVENTTKPLEYLCENPASLEAVIEIAAAVRGGRSELAEKPYFMQIVTPLPLYYAKIHTDQIARALEAGVPVAIGTVTIAGASAPVTMAGCLVHCLATDLAGMVLGQLLRKGAFCIGGSDPAFMEPSTGGRGGFPQLMLSDMVLCQICRLLGIPSMTGIGGRARSRRFNEDAAWEIATNMTQVFYARPANCDYMGLIDDSLTHSLHAMLYANEQAGMIRRMWRGMRIDEETMAMALTREAGPRGNYLAQPHTAEHCRTELWEPRYFGPKQPVSTSRLPDIDLCERIDADLREILAKHRPEPLPEATRSEIESIQRAFERGLRA